LVDLALLQSVSYIAGALGVCVAAAYYVMTLRTNDKLRKAQVMAAIFSRARDKDYQRQWTDLVYQYKFSNYEEWEENYGGSVNPEAHSTLMAVLNIFNMGGSILKDELVDVETGFSYAPPTYIIVGWEKMEPVIKRWRELYNDPKLGDLAEYLYLETKRRYPDVVVPVQRAKLMKGV
jgi:hypothetical protein